MRLDKRPLLHSLIISVLAFSWFTWLAQFNWDPHHDGAISKPAIDIMNGAIAYKDTFSQYGVIYLWIQAIVAYISDGSLLAIRISSVLFMLFGCIFVYLSLYRFVPSLLALSTIVIWLLLNDAMSQYPTLPWSSVYLLAFQGPLLYLIIKGVSSTEKVQVTTWLWSGMLVGIIFFIRMPQGIAHFVILWLGLLVAPLFHPYPLKLNFYRCISVSFGFLLMCLLVFGNLAMTGALESWYLQVIVMAQQFPTLTGQSWRGIERTAISQLLDFLRSVFPYHATPIWLMLPVMNFLAAIMLLMFGRWKLPPHYWQPLFGAILVGTASWSQYYPISEPRHYFWAAMPMLFAFSFLPYILLRGRLNKHKSVFIITVFMFLLAFPAFSDRMYKLTGRIDVASKKITSPSVLRGISVSPDNYEKITAITQSLEQIRDKFPNKSIVTNGYDPIYLNFEEVMPNWHPVYVSYDIAQAVYPDYQKQLATYMADNRPILVSNGDIPLHLGYIPHIITKDGLTVSYPNNDGMRNGDDSLFPAPYPGASLQKEILFLNAGIVFTHKNSAGIRTSPVSLDTPFLLEFILETDSIFSDGATIAYSLFGGETPQGLHLFGKRDKEGNTAIARWVGKDETKDMTFPLPIATTTHLAFHRSRGDISVWINGKKHTSIKAPKEIGSLINPLIIQNSIRLSDHFFGKIYSLRVQKGEIPESEISKIASILEQNFDHESIFSRISR